MLKLTLRLQSINFYIFISIFILTILAIFPLYFFPEYNVDQLSMNDTNLLLLIKNGITISIVIIIPAVFQILIDLLCTCSFILKDINYRAILSLVVVVPDAIYLLFWCKFKLAIFINVQIMIILVILLMILLALTSKDKFTHLSTACITLVIFFSSSVILVNYSSMAYPIIENIMISAAAVLSFISTLIIRSLALQLLPVDFTSLCMFSSSCKISGSNQELSVCLFSMAVCTGGYLIFALLLLCGIDYGLALFFLILVQIVSVLPILYLESGIAKRLVSQLQLELESKKAFLRTTSHEIRTPMNTIVLGLSLMRKEMLECGIENEDLSEIIKNLDESAEVVLDLVNDLLSHDKIKEGTMSLEKTPLSLWGLIENTIEPFQTQAKQSGVELSVDTSAIRNIQDYYIDGDKHKLSQVFRNLLSNALKFTKKGKKVVLKAVKIVDRNCLPKDKNTTRIKSLRTDIMQILKKRVSKKFVSNPIRFMQLEVVDEGAGIAQENIGRLFKEIVQFNAATLQGGKGSGLGMMITKGIVDLHGGRISVHSEGEGYGCTFTVFLPVYHTPQTNQHRSLFSVRLRDTGASRRPSAAIHPAPLSAVSGKLVQVFPSAENVITISSLSGSRTTGILESKDIIDIDTGGCRAGPGAGNASLCRDDVIDFKEERSSYYQPKLKEDSKLMALDHTESKSNSVRLQGQVQGYLRHQSIDASSVAQGLRILIVDDAKLNRKMLCRLIQGRCLETVEAENGFDAVEAVRTSIANEFPYDVILMDNRMPVMDGLTATKAIRELGYSGLIVGVTGDTQKEDYAAFLSHGANSVISKPLNLLALDKIILDYFAATPDNPKLSQIRAASSTNIEVLEVHHL